MNTVYSIVAVIDEKGGLGKDNQLLCHLPADLQYFKKITMGKPIILGSKTYLSIGKPLPGRRNIVVSRKLNSIDGVEVVPSLSSALELAGNVPEVMIIGGAQIFQEAMEFANQIYLTLIHHRFAADVFFPQIDETVWQREKIADHLKDEKNPYNLSFYKFTKKYLTRKVR